MYTKRCKTESGKEAGVKSMSEREKVVMMAFVKRKDASRSADHKLANVSEWDSVAESQNTIRNSEHESASE